MLGLSKDMTGFEQGGVNSADFYKLYNNEQLKRAQDSCLWVRMFDSVVSAIGQADDVILVSNDIYNLKLLADLTIQYCTAYHVNLVTAKTKLLPIFYPRHKHLVEYAKLTNEVSINGTAVSFVSEAEHVGIVRSGQGNMVNIVKRISSHKKALAGLGAAGITRTNRTNPAASIRIHNVYALPVLFSGLASLVLSKAEIKTLSTHLKNMLQSLQRLHQKTPRSVVFLLGGSLPAEAILHCKQLSLFVMVCHNSDDLLHKHAIYILSSCKTGCKSWFIKVSEICSKYGLPDPLTLLQSPPRKDVFKTLYKKTICEY